VIEDNEPLRERTVRILSSAGYDVLGARSGTDGIRVWRELGADLVITDVRMADMDGLQLILELRAAAPRLPVIVMSGDPGISAHLLRDVPGSGSVSFLAKPFRKPSSSPRSARLPRATPAPLVAPPRDRAQEQAGGVTHLPAASVPTS
jgi:CheY-like chemotaxis protein